MRQREAVDVQHAEEQDQPTRAWWRWPNERPPCVPHKKALRRGRRAAAAAARRLGFRGSTRPWLRPWNTQQSVHEAFMYITEPVSTALRHVDGSAPASPSAAQKGEDQQKRPSVNAEDAQQNKRAKTRIASPSGLISIEEALSIGSENFHELTGFRTVPGLQGVICAEVRCMSQKRKDSIPEGRVPAALGKKAVAGIVSTALNSLVTSAAHGSMFRTVASIETGMMWDKKKTILLQYLKDYSTSEEEYANWVVSRLAVSEQMHAGAIGGRCGQAMRTCPPPLAASRAIWIKTSVLLVPRPQVTKRFLESGLTLASAMAAALEPTFHIMAFPGFHRDVPT